MSALKEVRSFYDPEEAYCAWAYLNANGVRALIQNEYHLTSAPWLRVALGGYRLLAPAETKSEVEALFTQIETDRPNDQRERESSLLDRPDNEDSLKNRKRNWTWLPIAVWMGFPFVPNHRGHVIGALQYSVVALFYPLPIWSLGIWLRWW